MRHVLVPGRHPELSLAELQAVLERDQLSTSVVTARDDLILLETRDPLPPDVQSGLGGMVKWGEVVGETSAAEGQVVKIATDILRRLAAGTRGKFEFGLSFYDQGTHNMEQGTRIGLTIKKNLRAAGIASRWVQSREKTLSSVVVKTNHLTDRGVELCFFQHATNRLLITRTTAVQAFDEFSFRDYGRPARDVRSGMIPVKLARMLVNLSHTPKTGTLLDPFCGSGTILTEAAIMGFREVIGSDLESRAIESSAENLAWVREHVIRARGTSTRLFQGPAEKLDLTLRGIVVDGIATEPYLGPPLRGGERDQEIQKIKKNLETMYRGAFQSFAKILRPGGHVAIVFPVFRRRAGDVRLNILDDIKRSGFQTTPLRIRGREGGYVAGDDALLYSRPDQRVLREIRVFRFGD